MNINENYELDIPTGNRTENYGFDEFSPALGVALSIISETNKTLQAALANPNLGGMDEAAVVSAITYLTEKTAELELIEKIYNAAFFEVGDLKELILQVNQKNDAPFINGALITILESAIEDEEFETVLIYFDNQINIEGLDEDDIEEAVELCDKHGREDVRNWFLKSYPQTLDLSASGAFISIESDLDPFSPGMVWSEV